MNWGDELNGVPPIRGWHKVVIALFLLGMVLSVCNGCTTTITVPEPAQPEAQVEWTGLWHSDGAQKLCRQGVCVLVQVILVVENTGACGFAVAMEDSNGGGAWMTQETAECRATAVVDGLLIEHVSVIATQQGEQLASGVFKVDALDADWDTMGFSGVVLVRQ